MDLVFVRGGKGKKGLICPLRMSLWVGKELCLSTYEDSRAWQPLKRRVHTRSHHSGTQFGPKSDLSKAWSHLSQSNPLHGKWWVFTSTSYHRIIKLGMCTCWSTWYSMTAWANHCNLKEMCIFCVSPWNARRHYRFLKVSHHPVKISCRMFEKLPGLTDLDKKKKKTRGKKFCTQEN